MEKKEAEDYRYGYQHVGIVDDKEVSVRKVSNCDGWLDLDTGEIHTNDSMYMVKVNLRSISEMKAPVKLSVNEFNKAIKIIHEDDED